MDSVINNLKAVVKREGLDLSPIEGMTDNTQIASTLRKILNKARPYPALGDLVTIYRDPRHGGNQQGKVTSIIDKKSVEVTVENGEKKIAKRNSRGAYSIPDSMYNDPVDFNNEGI
jgi:hypothetical protein